MLVVVGVAAGGKFVSVRNDLVTQREAVNAAWSQVDVALQRRADLIPEPGGDRQGLRQARDRSASRTSPTRAPRWPAPARRRRRFRPTISSHGALSRLLVVVENYPQLKSNENFLRLQDELAGTENRIAVERRKYNEARADITTRRSSCSRTTSWPSMSGFTRNDAYFKTEPGARTAPKVQF